MGWETRNGKRYYYRKTRVRNRVASSYVGRGDRARLAELIDHEQQLKRLNDRASTKKRFAIFQELALLDRNICIAEEQIRAILEGALIASGYHTHHRHWRRKRCQNK